MKKFIKPLVACKVYLDRARMYYGYASMFALITLSLNAIHVPLKPLYVIVGVPVFLALSVFIGWVDKKIGLMEAEAHKLSGLNPTYGEIIERLDRIEKKRAVNVHLDKIMEVTTHSAMPMDRFIISPTVRATAAADEATHAILSALENYYKNSM